MTFDKHDDPSAARRMWFDSLARQADTYLRTPLFLQMMKSHIDTLTLAQQTDNRAGVDMQLMADRLSEIERSMQGQWEQFDGPARSPDFEPVDPEKADAWNQFLSALRMSSASQPPCGGVTPHKVVYRKGTLRLLWYGNRTAKFAEPILVCFALVNRPYVLDLQHQRSVVRRLLDCGFEVFLIDWGIPSEEDCELRLRDYVCELLQDVVDFVCRRVQTRRVQTQRVQTRRVNLLGYCMGGTLAAMYAALFPDRIRNLILMATPIDFAVEDGLLNLWAREEYFDVDKLVDTYGNCPGEFLRVCFQVMKPVQNFAEKYVKVCESLDDNAFLENFFALERWANDSIPVAGETFREYVKFLYQQNRLILGKLRLGEATVRLEDITCPLLLLVAEQDHLVPPGSTLAIEKCVRSSEVETMSIRAGHIGLAVGSKSHRDLWPEVGRWIGEHSTAAR